MRIDLSRIERAQTLLARHFSPTPLRRADSISRTDHALFLKIETGLPTGSFKVRGAVYSLSVNAATRGIREVVAASTGNHGAAVAYAARLLNITATIFVPQNPNPVKADRMRELGARLVEAGADLSAAIDAAYAYCDTGGAFFLHDAADADVPAGTGTIGLEVVAELPDVDAIYVPIGDTALIRGVASAAKHRKPSIRIIGAAAERAPVYYRSWHEGLPVETVSADTIADGLAVSRALPPNVDDIRQLVDDVRLVSDEELLDAMQLLMTGERVAAEPAGAAATAAWLKDPRRAPTSVALVTGGNIAPDVLKQVMLRSSPARQQARS